MEACTK